MFVKISFVFGRGQNSFTFALLYLFLVVPWGGAVVVG